MKRIYTLLVAAMAAVCGALADDVTITEVEFSLDVNNIGYFAGNFEGNVQSAIRNNISVASDAEYTLTDKFLCFVRNVTGVQAVNRGVALIGDNASREYLVGVHLIPKEGYTFSDTDYASISVKWGGNSVTPHLIYYNSYYKLIEVYVKLGAWETGTVATHTLTVANATYNSENFTGGSVAEGVKLTLTANTAATGYKFNGWIYTGITLADATSNVAEFTMPANDVTITAVYKKIDYTITIADDIENGTVSVTSGATTAHYDDEVALTVTPATGYELDVLSVKDADNNAITVVDNKFTMPASNVTVSATFKAKTATALATTQALDLRTESGRVIYDGDFQIFDLLGRNVTEMNGQLNGVYIVKVGDKAQKVVVK